MLLCGHPAPLLVRGTDVREVDGADEHRLPILTLLDGEEPRPFSVDLDGEWGLLLFTDGLFEGRATPGAADRFGVDGLVGQLRSLVAAGTPRDEMAPALFGVVERANGGALTDDVAVLLVGTAGWWA